MLIACPQSLHVITVPPAIFLIVVYMLKRTSIGGRSPSTSGQRLQTLADRLAVHESLHVTPVRFKCGSYVCSMRRNVKLMRG